MIKSAGSAASSKTNIQVRQQTAAWLAQDGGGLTPLDVGLPGDYTGRRLHHDLQFDVFKNWVIGIAATSSIPVFMLHAHMPSTVLIQPVPEL